MFRSGSKSRFEPSLSPQGWMPPLKGAEKFEPGLTIRWPGGRTTTLARSPTNCLLAKEAVALGEQRVSTRPTSAAYSFGSRTTFRQPLGVGRENGSTPTPFVREEPKFWGPAFQEHEIQDTPGPGHVAYHKVSLGLQPLSRNRSAPSFAFSKRPRFAQVEYTIRHRTTPGPGQYVA